MTYRKAFIVPLAFFVVAVLTLFGLAGAIPKAHAATAAPPLKVVGNHIVNATTGDIIQLHGANESSWVNNCASWNSYWNSSLADAYNGPPTWPGVNAIRIHLNEDCWLGINGLPMDYSAASYQSAVETTVSNLEAAGINVILTVSWSAPGTTQARSQNVMLDADHGPAFWQSVASVFGNDKAVILEPFNEPRPDGFADNATAAACVKNGAPANTAPCSDVPFASTGMQTITTDLRNDGAQNVLLIGGPNDENDLKFWDSYKPTDPLNDIAASLHQYSQNACNTVACWNSNDLPAANENPVITGEVGESVNSPCENYTFIPTYTNWATGTDNGAISSIAFVWDQNFGGCDNMLSAWPATASSPYGTGWKNYFATAPTNFGNVGGGNSWAVKQSVSTVGNTSASYSVTMPNNVAAGDKLLAFVEASGKNTVSSLKDNNGNAYSSVTSVSRSSCTGCTLYVKVYELDVPSADVGTKPTTTLTMTGTNGASLLVQEVSGLATGVDRDGTAANKNGAGGTSTGNPAYTSTAAGEYLITVGGSGNGTWTAPSGWTTDPNNVNGNAAGDINVAYKPSTGSAETGSWGLSGANFWGDIMVALK